MNTELDTSTHQVTDSGDHDLFAHYVDKTQATEAAVMGYKVVALCGKVWTPSRDPSKFPLCQVCKERYAEMEK